MDKDTKYKRINVDDEYKLINSDDIKQGDLKIKDSVVVVPAYSDQSGELDFNRATEVRVIVLNEK